MGKSSAATDILAVGGCLGVGLWIAGVIGFWVLVIAALWKFVFG